LDLNKRSSTISIGDLKVESKFDSESLRVEFDVQRDTTPYPNNASVRIYNLSPDHRESLTRAKEVTCQIEAGYEQTQQIFLGALRRGVNTSESGQGRDYVTSFEAGDGEKETQTATINKSYTKGTPISTVLNAFADALGVGKGNLTQHALAAKLTSGKTLPSALTISGPVVEEMSAFARSLELSWSIQDGALQILSIDQPSVPGSAVLLTPDTGLIEQPKLSVDKDTGKDVVVARSLLQPRLIPGALFRVDSETVTGSFAVRKSRHVGDTRGQSWYVDVEGIAP
jgi:hypothetical protein